MSWLERGVWVVALLATACGGEEFTSGGGGSGAGGGAGAAIAVVQATPMAHESGEDVPTMGWAVAPTAGNAIVVGISCFSEVDNCTIPAGGVSDNQGNSYALAVEGYSVASSTTHGVRPYLFVAEQIASSGDEFILSVDPNGSAADNQILTWGAIEVRGLAAPSLDQSGATVPTTAETTTVDTEGETAQANELAVALLADRTSGGAAGIAEDPSWTEHHVNQTDALGLPHSMVSSVRTAAEVVQHTWTHAVPSRGTVAVIATFRGAAQD